MREYQSYSPLHWNEYAQSPLAKGCSPYGEEVIWSVNSLISEGVIQETEAPHW